MQTQVGQIKQFLRAVYSRRRLFVVVAATIALVAVASSFFMPKVYEAESTVFIESNVLKNLMKGMTVSPSMNDRIRVLRYHMLSRDMLTRTLKKMDMDVDKRYASREDFEKLVKELQTKTNIRIRGNDLFFVSIVDKDPSFAKDYINTLVNLYVEENVEDKREEAYGANRFLDEQVTFYKNQIDKLDEKINEFRKETGIYSDVTQESIIEELSYDEDALKRIRSQKSEVLAKIKTIKRQLEMLRETTALGYNNSFDETTAVSDVDHRIEQLQARIEELLLVYNDQYPTVVKLRDQIEELEKRQRENPDMQVTRNEQNNYNPVDDPIYVDLKMRMNAAQSDLNALVAREREIEEDIESNQALLRDFPKEKKSLNDLEREREMQVAVYNKLLERVSVSEVSKQMEITDQASTFRIVDPAILPTAPVGLDRIFIMLLGVMGGMAGGLGAVYTAEHLDDSIKETKDLRELGVTVLAEIPFIWSAAEVRTTRRKDKATLAFAGVCGVMIGVMMIHDILGMSFIDRMLHDLIIEKFST